MRNKKGFTLVEIMGAIIIMGVIALIATTGFTGISKRMKEQAYRNKVKLIETKAEVYASETALLDTNVKTLMEQGYIEADNNKDEVINPVDESIMNCHMVKIENDNGVFYAKYQEEEVCDLESLIKSGDGLTISARTESGGGYESGTWTKENVELTLGFSTKIDLNNIESIIWNEDGYEEEIEINNNFNEQNKRLVYTYGVFDGNVSVEVYTKDKVRYKANIDIKIDKEAPVSYENEIKIDKEEEFTRDNKNVTITASDGNGSGIKGYYVGTNSNCTSNSFYKIESNTYTTSRYNGTYYVCVEDKVGNISKSIKFTISKVDNRAPSCTITANNSGVYISNKTDGNGANDSGLNEEMTYLSDGTLEIGYKYAYVYDNVGNMGICSIDIADYEEKGYDTQTFYCNREEIGYNVFGQTCESYTKSFTQTTETCKKGSSTTHYSHTVQCKKQTKKPTTTCNRWKACSSCGCSSYSWGSWQNVKNCVGGAIAYQECCNDIGKKTTSSTEYKCFTVSQNIDGSDIWLRKRSKYCSSFSRCSKCGCESQSVGCPLGYSKEGDKCVQYIGTVSSSREVSKCPSGSVDEDDVDCRNHPTKTYTVCSDDSTSTYNFKSSKSEVSICKRSHNKFSCKKSTVGQSYVSSCLPNFGYHWINYNYYSYSPVYSNVSSSGYCDSEWDEGKERIITSTPDIGYSFNMINGWSPNEGYSNYFECNSSNVGRSYTNYYKKPKDCPDGYNRISGTQKCYSR